MRRTIPIITLVALIAVVGLVVAKNNSSSKGAAVTLQGAGATFPEPVYVKWAGIYHKTSKDTINYQGVGSGAGIEQFTKKTVDFGASDAPMNDDELAAADKAGGKVLHIPMVLGAVAVAYNLPGVDTLKLDGPTLAAIYDGSITKWNDPKIAALNPDEELPSTTIAVQHRGDESGTSFVFTGYLSAVSPSWKSGPGQSKNPAWPAGSGAQGNDGVAAAVTQQKGAIGYVEIAYALQNHMQMAQLKNQEGEYIEPSLESTTAAGAGAHYPDDLRFSLLDSKQPGAYPIVSATWQLVWADPAKGGLSKDEAAGLKKWLKWELGPGQDEATKLSYAPLPDDLRDLALAKVNSL